jgi:SAM-dependent methyltransferase
MFFKKEFKSTKKKNPDIFSERKKIFSSKNKNLTFLLNKRFYWMVKHLKGKKIIIELGSGNGCIKKIIKTKIILTDIVKYPWIDKKVDMSNIVLEKKYKNKVDIFILNHSLHHCANPYNAIKKMHQYLKKGGMILMNEPEISFFLKIIQQVLNDESWSLNSNIFKKKKIFTSKDPWFSNTAIANLLFNDENKFHKHFPMLEIKKNSLSEFLIFLNSGGVNSSFFYVPLNKFFLYILNFIDAFVVLFFPKIFPLNRKVLIKKIK